MVATFSSADSEDVWGWDFTGVFDVGENCLPPKMQGGVSGDRDFVGSLEGLGGGGKFSAKAECGDT